MPPVLTSKAAALYSTPERGTTDEDFDSLINWLLYMEQYEKICLQDTLTPKQNDHSLLSITVME